MYSNSSLCYRCRRELRRKAGGPAEYFVHCCIFWESRLSRFFCVMDADQYRCLHRTAPPYTSPMNFYSRLVLRGPSASPLRSVIIACCRSRTHQSVNRRRSSLSGRRLPTMEHSSVQPHDGALFLGYVSRPTSSIVLSRNL